MSARNSGSFQNCSKVFLLIFCQEEFAFVIITGLWSKSVQEISTMALILYGVANYYFIIHRTQRLRLIKVQVYLESSSLDLFTICLSCQSFDWRSTFDPLPYLQACIPYLSIHTTTFLTLSFYLEHIEQVKVILWYWGDMKIEDFKIIFAPQWSV